MSSKRKVILRKPTEVSYSLVSQGPKDKATANKLGPQPQRWPNVDGLPVTVGKVWKRTHKYNKGWTAQHGTDAKIKGATGGGMSTHFLTEVRDRKPPILERPSKHPHVTILRKAN